jgi:hypothetical protein
MNEVMERAVRRIRRLPGLGGVGGAGRPAQRWCGGCGECCSCEVGDRYRSQIVHAHSTLRRHPGFLRGAVCPGDDSPWSRVPPSLVSALLGAYPPKSVSVIQELRNLRIPQR